MLTTYAMMVVSTKNREREMSAVKIRQCDEGTEYAAALISGSKVGVVDQTDREAMAWFCEDIMQALVGAFSPRLVWEGAQKAGLTTLQLNRLCAKKDLRKLDDLQWS